ncbi:MAG TPA: transglycosylase domain-containing protein, partial [Longimicrobiales bacterium]|nr:transglycosylase domain-containing protein [Longimicrobiales bacterium]
MSNLRRMLVRSALRGPVVAVVAVVVAWLLLPWPFVYRWRNPEVTSLMQFRERQWEQEGRAPTVRHTWIPLKDISPAVVRAVVAAEDGRFREHGGVDWV